MRPELDDLLATGLRLTARKNRLSDNADNEIVSDGADQTLVNNGNTISGAGTIGDARTARITTSLPS